MSTFWSKFWRDKHGNVAVWQTPNIPLIGWAACIVLLVVVKSGGAHQLLTFLRTAFIFTWAYLELTDGSCYFRRLLGAIVLASIIISHF